MTMLFYFHKIKIFSEVREIKERGRYDEEIGKKISKEG